LLGASLAQAGPDLNFGLDSIAVMNSVQGVFNNLAAPIWGVCADRGFGSQKLLLITAALGQGIVTMILACMPAYGAAMIVARAFNGMFLAGLRPIANGMVAKTTSSHLQGNMFGRIQMFILAGSSASTLVTGAIAKNDIDMTDVSIFGWQPFPEVFHGWRVAWFCVGLLSVAVSMFTAVALQDIKIEKGEAITFGDALKEECQLFGKYIIKPTFFIMVMQGVFGTIPWTVLWMMLRFFQLCGQPDVAASALSASQGLLGIPGVILGGYVGDQLFLKYTSNGRPLTAQITVMLGVPALYIMLAVLPPSFIGTRGGWVACFFCLMVFGIFGSWAQTGANYPILAQIVPRSVASRVMATESALENALATIIGPKAIDLLATKVFGFELDSVQPDTVDYDKAARLGAALAVAVCLPWLLAFIVYSCLHYSVPRDFKRLAEELAQDDRFMPDPSDPTKSTNAQIDGYRSFSKGSQLLKAGSRVHV